MGKNAIVGQSGGPTSVINASLAGVFESCKNRGAQVVYGMCNGVAGLLEHQRLFRPHKKQGVHHHNIRQPQLHARQKAGKHQCALNE